MKLNERQIEAAHKAWHRLMGIGDRTEFIEAIAPHVQYAQPVADAHPVEGMTAYYRELYQQALNREKNLIMQLEHDRTLVAMCITAAKQVVNSRDWLTEGRGCYDWNDDKWHEEFAAAAKEFLEVIEPLEKVAADWKDCPTNADDISEARKGIGADAQPVDGDVIARMIKAWYETKLEVGSGGFNQRMTAAARVLLDELLIAVYEHGNFTSAGKWEMYKAAISARILKSKKQTPVEMVTELIDAYVRKGGSKAAELAEKIVEKLEENHE